MLYQKYRNGDHLFRFATGTIARSYLPGSLIEVKIVFCICVFVFVCLPGSSIEVKIVLCIVLNIIIHLWTKLQFTFVNRVYRQRSPNMYIEKLPFQNPSSFAGIVTFIRFGRLFFAVKTPQVFIQSSSSFAFIILLSNRQECTIECFFR